MASFVGHSLGAVIAFKSSELLVNKEISRKPSSFIMPAVIGLVPDVDVLLNIFFSINTSHRGISHSLFISMLYAAGFSWILYLFQFDKKWRIAYSTLLISLVMASLVHPALDYLMARGPKIPLLWPLTDRKFLGSVQLIPTAYYSFSMERLWQIFTMKKSVIGYILELAEFLPLTLQFWVKKASIKIFLLLLSIAGFGITYILYN